LLALFFLIIFHPYIFAKLEVLIFIFAQEFLVSILKKLVVIQDIFYELLLLLKFMDLSLPLIQQDEIIKVLSRNVQGVIKKLMEEICRPLQVLNHQTHFEQLPEVTIVRCQPAIPKLEVLIYDCQDHLLV